MQRDSSKRRQRVAPGIYIKNGVYIAGFSDPNTGKWTMPTLKATTLTAAKRERAALLSALDDGRVASRSELTFDVSLDQYLEAHAASGARAKTNRTMRGIADRHVRPTRSRCRRSPRPTCAASCAPSLTCRARQAQRSTGDARRVRRGDP